MPATTTLARLGIGAPVPTTSHAVNGRVYPVPGFTFCSPSLHERHDQTNRQIGGQDAVLIVSAPLARASDRAGHDAGGAGIGR